jgi:2-oxoglutarate ferredoxin oxidoreductase subunit gamma
MMVHKIFLAGFGGQGIMLMGELLAYSAMIEHKQVTYMPSYGPEMRGGTANCSVVISEEPISSPIVTNSTILIAMNEPSLRKFENHVRPGGIIFLNESLIETVPERKDVSCISVNCTRLAQEIAGERLTNIVMLGAVIHETEVVPLDAAYEAMDKKFTGDKAKFIPMNRQALNAWTQVN